MDSKVLKQYYTEFDVRRVYNFTNRLHNSHWSAKFLRNYIFTYGIEEFTRQLNAGLLPAKIRRVFEATYKLLKEL